MTDPISDMLTRIRNAQAVGRQTVGFPFSKIKFEILKILKQEKFLADISKKGRGNQREIEVSLKYKDERANTPFIQGLKRISRSGQRIYLGRRKLNRFVGEKGITILSTSQGLMTIEEARRKKIGGEVICKIW